MFFRFLTDFYFDNLGTITILVGIASAIGICIFRAIKRTGGDLKIIIAKSLAGSGIPTGLALLLCAFDRSRLDMIKNAEIYILVSGICVLYLSAITIFPELDSGYRRPVKK